VSLAGESSTALGLEPARAALEQLARRFDLPVIETAGMLALTPAFDLVPLTAAMERHCALMREGEQLIAVVADPADGDLAIWLESRVDQALQWRLALRADIQAWQTRLEATMSATASLDAFDDGTKGDDSTATLLSLASLSATASPVVRLLDSALYDGLKTGASDIHLESTPRGLTLKYRIDGVLDQAMNAQGVELAEQVISRLKVLAELDIAERRVPQDGSFRVRSGGREIDLRVSIMPSLHGEDAVIRILDKRAMVEAHGALTLEALGFAADDLLAMRKLAQEPYGMLLVTGPTGSGKTTTLYGALNELHDGREKIITIEDPVEYQLPGILQIPVNEKKGLSFAKGLRSILRHDPDKIMVGEIRDRDTAEIAVQSALTGHLVLTTVHANNVFDVFGRFAHMGVDPYAFVSALNGIWAQRLIRINCPHCAAPARPSAQQLAQFGLRVESASHWDYRVGSGCGDCRGTGYRGRRAIAEILVLDDELRELIIEKAPIRRIKEAAQMRGTRSLRESALSLVQTGVTTLAEIKRVTMHA
jgi:general secretion pathway protein E